jgi:hypothetical protein
MAYVDRSFSITDDDFEGTFIVHNRPPVKEIALAFSLLAFGALGFILGFLMLFGKLGGDRGHGISPYNHAFVCYLFLHSMLVYRLFVLFQGTCFWLST